MADLKIAVIQQSPAIPWLAELRRAGFEIERFNDAAAYLGNRKRFVADLSLVSDLGGNIWISIEHLAKIKETFPTLPSVLIVNDSSENAAIAALKAGAKDYLRGSPTGVEILRSIRRLAGPAGSAAQPMRQWIGVSSQSKDLLSYASRLAAVRSNVLISGETGTGKDLAAELIHRMSLRNHRPFVALNCAAIPDSLLEGELFGREKGAYTGADSAYEGKLKLADSGTVFLDEIGDLTTFGQAKLLRVIESRVIQRLGSMREIPVDIRILAATNRDLRAMVEKGEFRRDLYYRLNVTRLELPPLRSRREDIVPLLEHFVEIFCRDLGVEFPGFSPQAMQELLVNDWPGNVRQLRNVVEELFVRSKDQPVGVDDLPSEVTSRCRQQVIETADERSRILRALDTTQWNKKRAAERLSWSRMTLYRKMAQYRISNHATASKLINFDGEAEDTTSFELSSKR